MKLIKLDLIIGIIVFLSSMNVHAQEWFAKPVSGTETRWISPENPTGAKGQGGITNKGAKGNAFYIIKPGDKKILLDVKGAGIIERIWMAGSIVPNREQKRSVRIDMYWDGESKPAVSAPIGDFFGVGLGLSAAFQSNLFASPEARSYNCTIPMPYRTQAKIEITNESSSFVTLWYDIDFLKVPKLEDNAMYFHAYWSRTPKTEIGKDFEILPEVIGNGRYMGTNIGVIGNPKYNGTWFGEGEVKIYLDGDQKYPTLVGTGTEDYIGTGGGQRVFFGPYSGSLIADDKNDLYAFYRYHIIDPVYFQNACKVTIQQIGSAGIDGIKKLIAFNPEINIIWMYEGYGSTDITNVVQKKSPETFNYLDLNSSLDLTRTDFSVSNYANFYRSDDVSATAYFYLDRAVSDLPVLPSVELRMRNMKTSVFDKLDKRKR